MKTHVTAQSKHVCNCANKTRTWVIYPGNYCHEVKAMSRMKDKPVKPLEYK